MSRPVRILHCPTDTGGNPWTLAQAEREIGLDSEVMVFRSSRFAYPSDIDLRFDERSKLGKGTALMSFFAQAVARYDVFHFNFGMSLFQGLPPAFGPFRRADLPLLRALGKGVVVTYQGCDIRQHDWCCERFEVNACCEAGCPVDACGGEVDARKAAWARNFDRYAHAIFALNPDLLHVLPDRASFLPYTAVDPREWTPVHARQLQPGDPIRIVHSPTHRGIKGTAYVVDAVERLREQFPNIELILVEGLPHEQVQEIYRTADLVVDQLLIGWYGAFSVEAMSLGKPVVCYLREDDLALLPADMREALPLINAGPHDIYDVLLGIAQNPGQLAQVAEKSRDYVVRFHDPIAIARTVATAYEAALGLPSGELTRRG